MSNFPKTMHDNWKTTPPHDYWFNQEQGEEDDLADRCQYLVDVADDLNKDAEASLIDDEFVKKLKKLQQSATKILEYMADDVRYRELFEDDEPQAGPK